LFGRGDLNSDGAEADIVDLTFAADYLFGGGDAPLCSEEADPNANNAICDIVDLTFLADYLFGGGSLPVQCP
jgi:hypothetical protein